MPSASCPITGPQWGEAASIFLAPSHQVFTLGQEFSPPEAVPAFSFLVKLIEIHGLSSFCSIWIFLSCLLSLGCTFPDLPFLPQKITFKHGACWQEYSKISSPTRSQLHKLLHFLRCTLTFLNGQGFFTHFLWIIHLAWLHQMRNKITGPLPHGHKTQAATCPRSDWKIQQTHLNETQKGKILQQKNLEKNKRHTGKNDVVSDKMHCCY